MKIFVKTLKGTHFEIEVQPDDTVADVKKNIETVQGSHVYPVSQQMLIHQGKVLKDGTTLEENKVAENSFVVIMLTKVKIGILLIEKLKGISPEKTFKELNSARFDLICSYVSLILGCVS
ncbi:unnamed protein product [Ilex paraguariensis]|uniref:Ubiquitin-like domain-containing protein n=1 Tax=Ilex paraguariensis TaxID=185542 RepID=A0ABC8S8Y1_9AQUA